ncbi:MULTISPECIES: GGDEF domain-containing protein [Alphaproteobacteria]|uniref:diguanylate cyclase n=2 Tax=Alphaproteobacteria TaxID=28211 RepID=A0A512HEL3_9HYPH|nr:MULTISPECIES: GGDEF domain-containing protein [Alphaproteobacteria]GEO83790.1 GGDEF domain-containing protein [Ciceribacter naphthalenivorans]GLR21332.1 GGDEF domain-containing protein [Ciceribacter naphthalenivorans]GLT04188.1 GGDEF domain-containing protein [Sphingomonas psychrolutea]
MRDATKNWIVRQLTLGEFSSRRAVVSRAVWMAAKIAMLAYGMNICAHLGLVSLGLLPYDLWPALVIATVLTPPVSFMVAVVAYSVVGFAVYDLAVSRAEFERISRIDMLSGLLNRRAFQRAFNDAGGDASLVLFDIDRFKAINDTFGHSVGDDVIAAVADVIRAGFTQDEVCARIGGEEFAVLWSSARVESIAERVEQVRERVAALEIPCGAKRVSVTISGGIADLPHGRSFNEIFSEADRALYVAKASGRDRIVRHRDIDSLANGEIVMPKALVLSAGARLAG